MPTIQRKKRRTFLTPYFTRKLLIEASRLGLEWDYNRQLSERIAEVPDLKYPVELFFIHTHRYGQPCEPHIRCMISLEPFKKSVVFCDMPFEFFNKLPRMRIPVTHHAVSARRVGKRKEVVTA
jgi:hypothetical protein